MSKIRFVNHPSIVTLIYVMHTREPATSVKQAMRHVQRCKVCRPLFFKEVEERQKRDEEERRIPKRGWWTGDDPYLSPILLGSEEYKKLKGL